MKSGKVIHENELLTTKTHIIISNWFINLLRRDWKLQFYTPLSWTVQ